MICMKPELGTGVPNTEDENKVGDILLIFLGRRPSTTGMIYCSPWANCLSVTSLVVNVPEISSKSHAVSFFIAETLLENFGLYQVQMLGPAETCIHQAPHLCLLDHWLEVCCLMYQHIVHYKNRNLCVQDSIDETNKIVCSGLLRDNARGIEYLCGKYIKIGKWWCMSGPLCHLVCSLQTECYSTEDTLYQNIMPEGKLYPSL